MVYPYIPSYVTIYNDTRNLVMGINDHIFVLLYEHVQIMAKRVDNKISSMNIHDHIRLCKIIYDHVEHIRMSK